MPITYVDLTRHDATIAPGDEVVARWTNSGHAYVARARVERVNAKSVRVALLEAVASYPVGWSIRCPRPAAWREWTWNNCVMPITQDRRSV